MLVALGILFTYATPYVKPAVFWLPAPMALLYPFMVLLNVCFAVFWLLRKPQLYALLSIICLLTGWSLLKSSFALPLASQGKSKHLKTHQLKVMTYNVRNFDLYNWNKNKESRDQIMATIQEEHADVVCFQDFYTQDDSLFNNIELLTCNLHFEYHHFENTLTLRGKDRWGAAIFSKYPLSNPQAMLFKDAKTNVVTSADIDVKGQTIRFFSAHLQSNFLAKKDINYVSELIEGSNDPNKNTTRDHFKSAISILQKLKEGYVRRSEQATDFAQIIRQSPYPVIVCGDFNDTPASYTYRTIATAIPNLKDAFLDAGWGMGNTYIGLQPLQFRIDYIFVPDSFEVSHFNIIEKKMSDHYPLSCELSW